MSTLRTNISDWAINHCWNMSFNLAEAGQQEFYLEGVGGSKYINGPAKL